MNAQDEKLIRDAEEWLKFDDGCYPHAKAHRNGAGIVRALLDRVKASAEPKIGVGVDCTTDGVHVVVSEMVGGVTRVLHSKFYAAPVAAQTWQPISTAPKDGTIVLVCGKGSNGYYVADAKWGLRSKWMLFDPKDDDYSCESYDHTHWMPLPAPPTAPSHEDNA